MIRIVNPNDLFGDPGINQQFSLSVLEFRKERGYDQMAFARRLRLSQSNLSRLEERGGCASLGDFYIMSMYLGIKVLDFWRHICCKEHCLITQIEIATHSSLVCGLNERFYRDTDYIKLCKQIEVCLSTHLKELVRDCDKTYEQIANILGKGSSLVPDIINGRRVLRLSELNALCEAIQVKSEGIIMEITTRMEAARLEA